MHTCWPVDGSCLNPDKAQFICIFSNLVAERCASIFLDLGIDPVSKFGNFGVDAKHPVLIYHLINWAWLINWLFIVLVINIWIDKLIIRFLFLVRLTIENGHMLPTGQILPQHSHLPSWQLRQDRVGSFPRSSQWTVHHCRPEKIDLVDIWWSNFKPGTWQLSLPGAPAQSISSEIRSS